MLRDDAVAEAHAAPPTALLSHLEPSAPPAGNVEPAALFLSGEEDVVVIGPHDGGEGAIERHLGPLSTAALQTRSASSSFANGCCPSK